VIPNAIDMSPFEKVAGDRAYLREKLSFPRDALLIGHVGRFDVQKNHIFLVTVFSELLRRLPSAHLFLVGDGQLKHEIAILIKSYGMHEHVHMLGIREDVPQVLSAMDLFLFPSLYEGLPVALVEAQAAGLPCVVSDSVSNEADIKAGLIQFVGLHESNDVWVDRILLASKMKTPDRTSLKMALNAAGFDVKTLVQRLEGIYSDNDKTEQKRK
jgi:glycosyltransferase involved in cell wall biosynthesis